MIKGSLSQFTLSFIMGQHLILQQRLLWQSYEQRAMARRPASGRKFVKMPSGEDLEALEVRQARLNGFPCAVCDLKKIDLPP